MSTITPRFVSEAISAFGRLDSLVNVAGVSAKSRGDLLDVSTDSYDFNFAVNTRGAFFVTQAVSRRMIQEDPQGDESARSVIFVTSSNAAIAAPERGEYAMSKAAATMMTKLYALRLAEHGIAVYEVRPGLIKTPMTGAAQERYDKLLAQGFTPINRWGTPNDIGRAVASLAFGDLPFTQAPLFRSTAECTSTTTETTAQPEQGPAAWTPGAPTPFPRAPCSMGRGAEPNALAAVAEAGRAVHEAAMAIAPVADPCG